MYGWRPIFIAHRGGAACEMENTRSAFLNAVRSGVDGVECDLQLSSDGELFLFHDDNMSLLGHPNSRLCDWSAQELRTCVYEPTGVLDIQIREPLLSDDQFLRLMCDHPQLNLYLELKIDPTCCSFGDQFALVDFQYSSSWG